MATSLVSTLGFRRGKRDGAADVAIMNDDEYVSSGKRSNTAEVSANESEPLFRLLDEDDGFDALFEVPYGLKHVKDVHVVMRHSVAVAGERREDLTHNSLFHPAFAGFVLGFSIGLAQAHRLRHMGLRQPVLTRMSRRQQELCEQWGAEIATYYLAVVDAEGIFGKDHDIELYGIADRWRLISDERRLEPFEGLKDCVASGKKAAHLWFEDETVDVPPYFLDALASFVDAHPDRSFD